MNDTDKNRKSTSSNKDQGQNFVIGRKTNRASKSAPHSETPQGSSDAKQRTTTEAGARTRKRSTPFVARDAKSSRSTSAKRKSKGGNRRTTGSGSRSRSSGHRRGGPAAPKGPRWVRSEDIDARELVEDRGDGSKNRSKKKVRIPSVLGDTVRVVPLGGVEEVGRNMTLVETKDDIFVIDAGFQFTSESEAPGVNYILPNISYLETNKKKVRALIVTHGHLDHIGGIPYVMEKIGNPPIYTRELTEIMIRKRNEEFPHIAPMDFKHLEPGQRLKVGSTYIKSFSVTHSIPDSMGVMIETPQGNVVLTGDLKLDHVNGEPTDAEKKVWSAVGKEKNLMFIGDSTNAEKTGFSMPESQIHKNLEDIITETKGRLIIGTFASQFERMIRIIKAAERLNKKVVLEGRSIRNNLEIAQKANLLQPKKGTIIPAEEMSNYPPDRILILATGAQGEEFAALMRIATNKHKFVRLNQKDTIILSSSVIPGNELSVQKLKDNLYRHDLKIYHYRTSDVHSTGHGNSGELVWINKQVGAKFFMPAYGYHSMTRCHAQAAIDAGVVKKENVIVADNGQIIDIEAGEKLVIRKEKVPAEMMMVDGYSIGEMQHVVIRDRQMLAQEGIFVIIASVDVRAGQVRKSPDIISRGFVYLRESQDLLRQARFIAKRTIEDNIQGMNPINFEFIKDRVTDEVTRFLVQQTAKRPMVLPVIIAV